MSESAAADVGSGHAVRESAPKLIARAVLDVLLLIVIAVVVGGALMVVANMADMDIGSDDSWRLEMLTSGVFIVGLLVLQRALPLPVFLDQPTRVSTAHAMVVGVAAGTVMLLFDSGAEWLLERIGISVNPANETAIRDTLKTAPIAGMLMYGVLAPVVEEWLLRYRMFGHFWRGGRPWLGVILTSVFFAALHEFGKDAGQSWGEWSVLILLYAYAGVVFALAYRYTGRLLTAIVAHAVNNAVLCMAMLAGWI